MTPEQREAHLRMLASLPRRRHESETYFDMVARNKRKTGRTSCRRPVIVDGVRYESIGEAARRTGITRQTIYQRIQRRCGAAYAG